MSSSSILKGAGGGSFDDAVVLALGANLRGEYPSLEALLEAAVSALPEMGFPPLAKSGWWRSAAWPDPAAPAYLNGVVLVETDLAPREALSAALALERRFGRARTSPNAPRTLDIDLVAYGRRRIDEPGLVTPHPRAYERRFVMGPLAEIAPAWRHPVLGLKAAELAARAPVGGDARPLLAPRESARGDPS
jgi:2-amino-4-hydroxy-6-hydroxymethyldihydropteridine diphosphokinase